MWCSGGLVARSKSSKYFTTFDTPKGLMVGCVHPQILFTATHALAKVIPSVSHLTWKIADDNCPSKFMYKQLKEKKGYLFFCGHQENLHHHVRAIKKQLTQDLVKLKKKPVKDIASAFQGRYSGCNNNHQNCDLTMPKAQKLSTDFLLDLTSTIQQYLFQSETTLNQYRWSTPW